MPSNLTIKPRRNENIERVIKRFNKKVKKLGIIDELKDRRFYIKPSERRRKAKKRADARRRKEEAKRKKQTT
jgi:small subunit ribosomal protein S21